MTTPTATRRSTTVVSYVLSAVAVLFLLLDAVMKVVSAGPSVETSAQLGFTAATVPLIGWVLLICTVAYCVPRTAVLGAVLLTGYLGGAVTAQLRVEAPLFNLVFPIILGALLWVGLWLRHPGVRALVSVR